MINYTVIDDDPEDFNTAKKVKLEKPVTIHGDTYEEVIIAESLGLMGGSNTAIFAPEEDSEHEHIADRKLAESNREDEALFRLVKDSDNLEL